MIKSSNVTLGAKSAVNVLYVNYFKQLFPEIQPALDFIEKMTNSRGVPGLSDIKVEFSPEIKRKYRITDEEIKKAIDEMFDGIDKSGEIPPGYDWVRREWERRKERNNNEDYRDNFHDDDFYGGLLGRIIDGWLPWADEVGLPDIKRRIRRVAGMLKARNVLISVEYYDKLKTIVLYENVLGDTHNNSNWRNWLNALACGLFYAWYYDCGGKAVKDYVIEGLCEDFSIHYSEDVLGKPAWECREFFCYDMFEFPEAAAQYMECIELKDLRGKYILFRRIFKKATEKAVYAESYLEMAYGLYEGLSMQEIVESRGSVKSAKVSKPVTTAGLSPLEKNHLEFWNEFLNVIQKKGNRFVTYKPTSDHWLVIPCGSKKGTVTIDLVNRGHFIRVGFYIHNDQTYFDALRGHQSSIESSLGTSLLWDPKPGKKASGISTTIPGLNFDNKSNYSALMDQTEETVVKLISALQPYL